MKTCIKCKQDFPKTLEYFHKHGKYLQSYCKKCEKARSKDLYLANPEKKKANNKAWKKANPEKVNTNNKAWALANPEKQASSVRRHRAKKLGNGFEPYTLEEVFETYGTNCCYCDLPINFDVSGKKGSNPQWRSGLHIDHFIDIALGGPDTLENVRPSHAWCNETKIPNLLPVTN